MLDLLHKSCKLVRKKIMATRIGEGIWSRHLHFTKIVCYRVIFERYSVTMILFSERIDA